MVRRVGRGSIGAFQQAVLVELAFLISSLQLFDALDRRSSEISHGFILARRQRKRVAAVADGAARVAVKPEELADIDTTERVLGLITQRPLGQPMVVCKRRLRGRAIARVGFERREIAGRSAQRNADHRRGLDVALDCESGPPLSLALADIPHAP